MRRFITSTAVVALALLFISVSSPVFAYSAPQLPESAQALIQHYSSDHHGHVYGDLSGR